jgi:ribonucleoside-diphosphate reductase beta chain
MWMGGHRSPQTNCGLQVMEPVFPAAGNPFPWMSEAMDLKKKDFFETGVFEYQKGGSLTWD